MGQRQAVDPSHRYAVPAGERGGEGRVLDERCATTGWHRNHTRTALGLALKPKVVGPAAGPPSTGPMTGWRCGSAGRCWAPRRASGEPP